MQDLEKKARTVVEKLLRGVGLEPSYQDEVDIEYETTPRTGVAKGTVLPVGGLIRIRNRPDLFQPNAWYLGIIRQFSHKDLVFKYYVVDVAATQRVHRLVVPDTDLDISVPAVIPPVPPSERSVSP